MQKGKYNSYKVDKTKKKKDKKKERKRNKENCVISSYLITTGNKKFGAAG